MRPSTLLFHLTQRLLYTKWRDAGRGAEAPPLRPAQAHHQASGSTTCLVCKGGTYPAQLMYQELADMACNRITAGDHARASSASGRSRRCSIRTTPPARPRTSASTRRKTDRWETDARALPRQLGGARQRLGGRVLPRRRGAPAGAGLRQEPQPRPRGAVPLRLRDAHVPARLHRAGGRRPRRRRPAAPGRRDQGLPARGRQGEEGDDGDLLGARREQPRHATAAGRSPSSPRSTRSRPTSRRRSRASSTR